MLHEDLSYVERLELYEKYRTSGFRTQSQLETFWECIEITLRAINEKMLLEREDLNLHDWVRTESNRYDKPSNKQV